MVFDFTGIEDWARRKAASFTRKDTLMEVGEWLEARGVNIPPEDLLAFKNGILPGTPSPDTEYHERKED